jgi:hypothetical protein
MEERGICTASTSSLTVISFGLPVAMLLTMDGVKEPLKRNLCLQGWLMLDRRLLFQS